MYLAEKLHEEVFYYKNVIEDPKRLVELINELDSDSTVTSVIPKWNGWLSNSNDGHAFGGKKDFAVHNLEHLVSPRKDDVSYVVQAIRNGVKKTAQAYYNDRGFEGTPNISPFAGVCRYDAGCAMGAHFDAQAGDKSLKYSIVLYLNDDYEGGEISFIIRDYDLRDPANAHLKPYPEVAHPANKELVDFTLKPEAGSALIFPSVHPYKHQVHIMTSGEKYIFPGFVFMDDYNPADPASVEKYNGGAAKVES